MLRLPRIVPVLALALVGNFALAGSASAQILDNTWFKLTLSSKGYAVNGTEPVVKGSMKTTGYMHMTWNADDEAYDYDLWTEDANGVWSVTYSAAMGLSLGANEALYSDVFIDALLPDGNSFEGYFTARISIKLNSDGVTLKSASFQSLGGEAVETSSFNGNAYCGDIKIKGKTVAVDKLPFVPA